MINNSLLKKISSYNYFTIQTIQNKHILIKSYLFNIYLLIILYWRDDMNQLKNTDKQKISKKNNRKKAKPVEIGGRKGLDPTRYGDWEKNGRCIDF